MNYYQIGGGNCTLCLSPDTNKSTCPLNPTVRKPNYEKHYKSEIPRPNIGQLDQPVHRIPNLVVAPIKEVIDQVPALIKSRKIKAQAKKEKQDKISPPYKRSLCKNESTIQGDDTADMIANPHLFVTDEGFCFNVEEDLLPMFQQGNFQNPYNGLLFSPAELEEMLKYPHIKNQNRELMRDKFKSGLTDAVLKAIRDYPEVFKEIYRAGYSCFIDYTDKYEYPPALEFYYALEGIGKLVENIEALPQAARDIFNSMKTGSTTLATILVGINETCVHGGGLNLLKIFMRQFHLLPDDLKPDISDLGIIDLKNDIDIIPEAQKNAYLLIFNTNNSILNRNITLMYIYDEPTSGRNDLLTYFLNVYQNNTTLVDQVAHQWRIQNLEVWKTVIWQSVQDKYDGSGDVLNYIAKTLRYLDYTGRQIRQ